MNPEDQEAISLVKGLSRDGYSLRAKAVSPSANGGTQKPSGNILKRAT
jgi:hypothetical protein